MIDDDSIPDTLLRGLAAAPVPPALKLSRRYRLGEKLGEGGFGVVYEGEDLQHGGRVAIKLLRSASADWLYRFKREFRSLAGLVHPNLVRLHELSVEDGQWFFTMERVDGVRFSEYVAGSTERLRASAAQVARALCALHASGQIHRDVKPANILVEKNGRVVLLDFGLVLDVKGADTTVLAGTPAYMSPEQGAQLPMGPASDFYSLGLMLFEALTGRLPFEGTTLEILSEKLKRDAPPPRTLVADVPEDLDALCKDLLARDPAARPSGDQIVQRLEASPASTLPPAPVERFVGREQLLERLLAEYRQRRAGALFLHGPSGIGKTTVISGFRAALAGEPVVLAGKCRERELVPYKALDAVIDELARYLRKLPAVDAAGLMPRDAAALGQLFPVLLQSPAMARARPGALDANELRRRGAQALRELLARLADRHPVVLLIDDLQWGDADSAVLVAELLRPPDAPALLLLGSYRSDEAAASPFLRRLGELRAGGLELPITELAVEPLDAGAARTLAESLLAEACGDLSQAEKVAAESHGSPLFILELAAHRRTSAPASLAAAIEERVSRLPEPAQRLLRVVAVAGRAVEISVAASAAELEDDSLQGTLALLRAERLIRGFESQVESYHHRIQESLVAALDAGERRRLCSRLAEALEGHGHDDERLAALLLSAGQPARAAGYLVRAAERAAEALAFDQAADLFRAALETHALGDAEDARLRARMIEALSWTGRCREAGDACLAAAAVAADDQALELRVRAAANFLMAGENGRGAEILSSVLPPLGLRVPRSTGDALVMFLSGRLRLKLRGLAYQERSEAPRDARLRLDALWAAVSGFAVIEPLYCAALAAQHLLLALDTGEPARLLRALNAEIMTQALARGSRSQGRLRVVVPLARKLAAQLDRPEGHAALQFAEGTAAMTSARYAEAYERLSDAEERMRRGATGEALELTRATTFRLSTMFLIGRSGEIGREIDMRLREADERGNLIAWVWSSVFASWVRASQDRVPEALELLERVKQRWPQQRFQIPSYWLKYMLATIGLYRGGDAAWSQCLELWPALEESRLSRSATFRIHALWLRARAGLTLALDDAGRRREAVSQLKRDLGRLHAERVPLAECYAATIEAGLASLRGDSEAAVEKLAAIEPLLETHSLELLVACARRQRGRLLGGERGRLLVEKADEWLRTQEVADPAAWVRAHLPL